MVHPPLVLTFSPYPFICFWNKKVPETVTDEGIKEKKKGEVAVPWPSS
jgi:hypothetical protein